MSIGISINIGLNGVDPNQYGGWDGSLVACEFDAEDVANIARGQGFNTRSLLTAEATHDSVIAAVRDAAKNLKSGDMLFLTYSGHGGQVPDTNGDEPDALDETWVLFDQELVDDELYSLWSEFKPGVRILVLSDSCHSGSVIKLMEYKALWSADLPLRDRAIPVTGFRTIPEDIQTLHYERNKPYYESVQAENPNGDKVAIGASVILISGCQDNQLSGDGPRNGVFTAKLRQVWDDGAFKGDYPSFHKQIRQLMPGQQTPNYFKVGASSPAFESQEPFTI
jgi:hypothetical protein